MKTLPAYLNGNIQWLYNGNELRPLTEEDTKFVVDNLDSLLLLRNEFTQKIKTELLDPFDILKHKFKVLNSITENLNKIDVRNITLFLLFEDLCKFMSISLSDITDKIISLTKVIPSKYLSLYKNKSLVKLVEALEVSDNVNATQYSNILHRHKRILMEFFKLGLNDKGQPLPKNFEELRNELFQKRKKINDYRDNIAAHVNHKTAVYQPQREEVKQYIDYLENIIFCIYFLATYRSYGNDLDGAGVKLRCYV